MRVYACDLCGRLETEVIRLKFKKKYNSSPLPPEYKSNLKGSRGKIDLCKNCIKTIKELSLNSKE